MPRVVKTIQPKTIQPLRWWTMSYDCFAGWDVAPDPVERIPDDFASHYRCMTGNHSTIHFSDLPAGIRKWYATGKRAPTPSTRALPWCVRHDRPNGATTYSVFGYGICPQWGWIDESIDYADEFPPEFRHHWFAVDGMGDAPGWESEFHA